MDKTLRKIIGTKVDPDGTVVSVLLETVEGVIVEIRLVPEMIMELILNLMSAKTEAWVRSEGGVPGEVPAIETPMRRLIPARSGRQIPLPGNKRLVQIDTEGGAVFEFLLPAEEPDQGR